MVGKKRAAKRPSKRPAKKKAAPRQERKVVRRSLPAKLIIDLAIPKDATAMAIIRGIESWAQKQESTYQSRILWHILTALRGPDNGSQRLKDGFTAPIRGMTIPTVASHSGGTVTRGSSPSRVLSDLNEQLVRGKITASHFTVHARQALVDLLNEEKS